VVSILSFFTRDGQPINVYGEGGTKRGTNTVVCYVENYRWVALNSWQSVRVLSCNHRQPVEYNRELADLIVTGEPGSNFGN